MTMAATVTTDSARSTSKGWKDYVLHVLMVAVMALTGLAWNTMAAHVDRGDEDSKRKAERLAVAETQIQEMQRRQEELDQRLLRMDSKLDRILDATVQRSH